MFGEDGPARAGGPRCPVTLDVVPVGGVPPSTRDNRPARSSAWLAGHPGHYWVPVPGAAPPTAPAAGGRSGGRPTARSSILGILLLQDRGPDTTAGGAGEGRTKGSRRHPPRDGHRRRGPSALTGLAYGRATVGGVSGVFSRSWASPGWKPHRQAPSSSDAFAGRAFPRGAGLPARRTRPDDLLRASGAAMTVEGRGTAVAAGHSEPPTPAAKLGCRP